MRWLNEPPSWSEEGDVLTVTTGDRTDFWRETHYGFVRDDGHLRYREAIGDFTAEVAFSGEYAELYDQAGLMLRLDPRRWVKAGVEFVEGRPWLSVVATNGFSDWSTAPADPGLGAVRLRLSRHGTAVRVEWAAEDASTAGARFEMLRLAHLPNEGGPALVGPMCCSPQRAGFRARFWGFRVGPAIARDLHGPG